VAACGQIMREMGWNPELPSNCFGDAAPKADGELHLLSRLDTPSGKSDGSEPE
jgi:hypothetical protein